MLPFSQLEWEDEIGRIDTVVNNVSLLLVTFVLQISKETVFA